MVGLNVKLCWIIVVSISFIQGALGSKKVKISTSCEDFLEATYLEASDENFKNFKIFGKKLSVYQLSVLNKALLFLSFEGAVDPKRALRKEFKKISRIFELTDFDLIIKSLVFLNTLDEKFETRWRILNHMRSLRMLMDSKTIIDEGDHKELMVAYDAIIKYAELTKSTPEDLANGFVHDAKMQGPFKAAEIYLKIETQSLEYYSQKYLTEGSVIIYRDFKERGKLFRGLLEFAMLSHQEVGSLVKQIHDLSMTNGVPFEAKDLINFYKYSKKPHNGLVN